MHRGRAIAVAGTLLGLASLASPALSADTLGDVSVLSANGHFTAAALAAAGVVAIAGDRRESLTGIPALAAAAAATLAIVLAGAVLIDALAASRDAAAEGADARVGWGVWVLLAATALTAGGIGVALNRRLG